MATSLKFSERSVPSRWQCKNDSLRLKASELLTLTPAGETKIPRSAIRTPEGAKFLRLNPQYRQQAWIERQVAPWLTAVQARFPIGIPIRIKAKSRKKSYNPPPHPAPALHNPPSPAAP